MQLQTPQMQSAPGPASRLPRPVQSPRTFRAAVIAPLFSHDPDWPWLSRVAPLDAASFDFFRIPSMFKRLPKATGLYRQWMFRRGAQVARNADLIFSFSTDINMGITPHLKRNARPPRRIYVGFSQDGHWSQEKIERIGAALRACDAVTMFTEQERQVYLTRYGLEPDRAVVIPIHTDDVRGYTWYDDFSPMNEPYALSMGLHNRRFTETARACNDLKIPLVILTRPNHENDDLDELRALGARVITDADQPQALNWLAHAQMAIMAFQDRTMPGGYTTLMNAMFMRTPFIVSDCLGMREHVTDNETGFVVPGDDEAALHTAIERLWTEPGLAHRFGEAGLAHAERRHSLEAAARSFHELSCRVLDQPQLH